MIPVLFSPLVDQVAVGATCGVAEFLFSTTCQKACMLAGVKFEEIEDEEDVPPSERLDKHFLEAVIIYPVGEELVFRGLFQPFLAKRLSFYMPQLAAPALLGISRANAISAIVVGTGFGVIHYFGYKSGGKQVAVIGAVSGSFCGLVKERFGFVASVLAHMVHNFCTGLLDKYYPVFLESPVVKCDAPGK